MSESQSHVLPIDQVVHGARQRFAAMFASECDHILMLIEAAATGEASALDELQQLTHRLAGRAGMTGFPEVGEEAARIDALARAGAAHGGGFDASAAFRCVNAMREAFQAERAQALRPVPAETPATAPPSTAAPSGAPKQKVLLADDDEDQRYLVGRLLQRAGFVTVTVDSGQDVLSTARAERPDIIVLDVQMPGQDGFATGRQLKADPALASVPIVFLSGHVDVKDRLAGLELGAEDYLPKSIDPRELVLRVQKLAKRPPAAPAADAPVAKLTVLLADDDPEVMRITDAHVKASGYDTLLAFDGEQALALVQSRHPEALLLDLMLPRLSGFDLLRKLRQSEGARPRTLVLSARGREEDVTRAFELGADDYMTKPFSPQELLARLGRLVGRLS